jgi:hypothetical protein
MTVDGETYGIVEPRQSPRGEQQLALDIVSNGDNAGHSTLLAAYRYCTINAAGEVTPSAQSETFTLAFLIYDSPSDDYTIRVPHLRHAIGTSWVELYPNFEAHSVVSVLGERSTVEEIQLSDLLSIVDRAERIAQQG